MDADLNVVVARRNAEAAKHRLLTSAHVLQQRIAPSRLANDAIETAKERGNDLVDTVVNAARGRPALFASAGIGILAFLARRRIGRLIRRRKPTHELVAARRAKPALPRP